MRGRVTRRKHDANGNPIGRSQASPAFGKRLYILEFDDNDRTELTANNHVCQQETVCLALTIAALNDQEVKVDDVLNAYITAPITKKVWTTLGPEFGSDAGKTAIIVRALYGLKSAGAAFRDHLDSFMRQMRYSSYKANPDLWMKAERRPDDKLQILLLYISLH